jgi:hypothetical protein
MDLKKEILIKSLEFLEKDIRGKPLYRWILQGLLYSFAIWIPITIWIGYQKYTEIERLKHLKNQKLQLLSSKERQYQQYLSKLNDIKIAYMELKKYFREERIELIRRKLDKLLNQRKLLANGNNRFIVQSLGYDNFNYPLRLSSFYTQWQSVSLPDINFNSKAVKDFNDSVKVYFGKYTDLKDRDILGDVKVSLNGNKLILTFEPGKGLLKIEPIRLVGFISDIKRVPAYPAISFLKTREEFSDWSQLYIGWKLKFYKGEGK